MTSDDRAPVIEAIDAITLAVRDMARSVRFYANLGFEIRYGGEEFGILLTDTNLKAAEYVSERLRASIESRLYEARSDAIRVTASFGVSCTEDIDCELTPASLIQAADRALYASREAGRNCIHLFRHGELVHLPG